MLVLLGQITPGPGLKIVTIEIYANYILPTFISTACVGRSNNWVFGFARPARISQRFA